MSIVRGCLTLQSLTPRHFLFQASFVPLMALRTDPMSPDRSRWQESMRLTCDTLRSVQGDPLADRCLGIIDLLMPTVSDDLAAHNDVHTGLLDVFQANPMWHQDMVHDL